jgi:hypothetical protein
MRSLQHKLATWVGLATGAVLLALGCAQAAPAGTLDIYFIDVEGGQSTLLVTPQRESLLIDTGWAGNGAPNAKPGDPAQSRDARRIAAAVHDGGALATFETLHHEFGPEDVWQLHRSEAADGKNFTAEHIANLDESSAHWIKLDAAEDGSFRVTNGRSGASKAYAKN